MTDRPRHTFQERLDREFEAAKQEAMRNGLHHYQIKIEFGVIETVRNMLQECSVEQAVETALRYYIEKETTK